MNRTLLIVAVIILVIALGWAYFHKPTEPEPEQIGIRGTVMDPIDVTPGITTIKVQNYEDLTEWTVNLTGAINQDVSALGYSRTVSVGGTKAGERTINATSIVPISLPGIEVTKPVRNDIVDFPMVIEGKGRAFENTIGIQVKNADGSILAETHAMVDAPNVGLFGRFHVELTYPTPKSENGTVEVFESSAKDGSHVNPVIVPIRFAAIETTQVKAYFSNRVEDPEALDCTKVSAVTRLVKKTTGVAQAALTELLKGPSANESLSGFFSNITAGTKLNSVTINGTTATADFSQELEPGGGSCRVSAIRAQITNTLLQFPTIKKVVISINGKSEGILQP